MKISEFFNCKSIAVALIFAFTFASSLNGQSFVQLNDYSGYRQNVASFQIDSLSYYANEIKEVISLNSAVNDFQVFDFGFYYHSRFFDGDYPEILTLAKNEIESTTSNYFLIAHQVNEIGEIERIRSYFKLDTDDFICLNDSLLSFDLQYLFDDAIVNHTPKNIHEIYDLKLNSLKQLLLMLNEGYCCSQYEELKQFPSRSGEVSFEALECMEDFSFLTQLYDQLKIDTVFQNLMEQVKIISELFSLCKESGYLKPLAENGIVPMCFWTVPGLEDFPININNPLIDNPCICGVIDGISAELIETFNLIQAIPDILLYPDRLIRSYLSYYSYCKYGVFLSPYQVNIMLDWFFDDESLNPTFRATILALASYRSNILRAIDYFYKPSEEQCREHEERILQFEMMASILLHPLAFEMFVVNLLIELIEIYNIIGWETPRERYWLCHYVTRVGVNIVGLPKGAVKAAQLKASLLAKDFSSSRLIIGQRVRKHLTNLYVKKLEDLPSYRNLTETQQLALRNDFLNNPNGLATVYKGDLVGAWKKMFDTKADRALRRNHKVLEVLNTPYLSRPPDPSTYLSAEYISKHLSKFDEGAVRFTTQKKINKHGGKLGGNEAFVIPKKEFDLLMRETNRNFRLIEKALGLDDRTLTGGNVVIAWIRKENFSGLKIPSGNEGGVNAKWLPGGVTLKGYSEAILDLSNPNIPYIPLN